MIENLMKEHIKTYSKYLNVTDKLTKTDMKIEQVFHKDLDIDRLKTFYHNKLKKPLKEATTKNSEFKKEIS